MTTHKEVGLCYSVSSFPLTIRTNPRSFGPCCFFVIEIGILGLSYLDSVKGVSYHYYYFRAFISSLEPVVTGLGSSLQISTTRIYPYLLPTGGYMGAVVVQEGLSRLHVGDRNGALEGVSSHFHLGHRDAERPHGATHVCFLPPRNVYMESDGSPACIGGCGGR